METALYRTAVPSPAHGEKSAVGTHHRQQSRWLRPCGRRCRAPSGHCAALDLGMSLACDPPCYQADFVHSAGLQMGGCEPSRLGTGACLGFTGIDEPAIRAMTTAASSGTLFSPYSGPE